MLGLLFRAQLFDGFTVDAVVGHRHLIDDDHEMRRVLAKHIGDEFGNPRDKLFLLLRSRRFAVAGEFDVDVGHGSLLCVDRAIFSLKS